MNNQANEAMTILRQLLYVMKVGAAKETGNNEDDVFAGSKSLAKKALAQKDMNIKKDSLKKLSSQDGSLKKMSTTLDKILKELRTQTTTISQMASSSGSGGIGSDELLMMQMLDGFGGGKDKTGKPRSGGKASGLRGILSKLKNIRGGGIAGIAGVLGGASVLSTVEMGDNEAQNKKTAQTIEQANKSATKASEQASKQASTLAQSADDATKNAGKISTKLKSVGKLGGKLLGPAAALATVGFAAYDYKTAETAYEESSKTVDDYVSMKKQQDSAIGGAIGATAGAAIGGVVGSIVPGLGTVIGGAVGGIVGGYIGDVIGEKFAEDSAAQDYYDKKKKDEEAERVKQLALAEKSKTSVQTVGDIKSADNNQGTASGSLGSDFSMPIAETPVIPTTQIPGTTQPGQNSIPGNAQTKTTVTPLPTSASDISKVVNQVAKVFKLDPGILSSQIAQYTNGTNDPTKSLHGGFLNTGIKPSGKSVNDLISALSKELSIVTNGETSQAEVLRRLGWWNSLNSPVFNDLITKGFLSDISSKGASIGDGVLASAISRDKLATLIPSSDNEYRMVFNDPMLLDRLQAFESSGNISSADTYFKELLGISKNSTANFSNARKAVPLARGAAVVDGATPAIIGEHGPETVIPLDERGANFMGNMLKDFMPSNSGANIETEVVIDPLIQYFEDKFMKNLAQIVLAGISSIKINQPVQQASQQTTDGNVIINQTNVNNNIPQAINIFGV